MLRSPPKPIVTSSRERGDLRSDLAAGLIAEIVAQMDADLRELAADLLPAAEADPTDAGRAARLAVGRGRGHRGVADAVGHGAARRVVVDRRGREELVGVVVIERPDLAGAGPAVGAVVVEQDVELDRVAGVAGARGVAVARA